MPITQPNFVVRAWATVWVGTTVYCLGRIKGKNNQHNMVPLTATDFVGGGSSITYVVELDGTVVDDGTLDPPTVMLNALSMATIWTVDRTGFNFIAEFDGELFTDPNVEYNVNVKFLLNNGVTAKAQFGVKTRQNITEPEEP